MENIQLNDYYNRFGVDEKLIRETMAEALSKGGDYCDLYFQHTISHTTGLQDKTVNRAFSNIDFGLGIRVLKGEQYGFSFTEELTPKAIKQAAKTAANIANAANAAKIPPLQTKTNPNYYKIQTSWEDISIKDKIPFLEKLNDRIFELDKRIQKCTIYMSNETSYVLFANSEGKIAYDYRPMSLMMASVIAEYNGEREQFNTNYSGRIGFEICSETNLEMMAKKAVEGVTRQFGAGKPQGGEMEVILGAGESGILLHEAIGHPFEADFNRKGISIFSDKMNTKIAENFVSIVDDGTNEQLRGSINIDDEGNDTQKTYLVKDGILTSYMHDRISAKYYKVKPTGNGRRESFRHAPLPRMRNTYMLPGPHTKDEIIKSVKKGIIAENYTNGEVQIGAGDFTFYVKSGYLIENGKITMPIKDINVIGNGPDILGKITMVGNDLKMSHSGWSCGKDGQTVPVSLGMPTVKVSKMTVGGI